MSVLLITDTTYTLEKTVDLKSWWSLHQRYSAGLPTQLPSKVDTQMKYSIHLGFVILLNDTTWEVY
jgi:hypothetical protein